MLFVKRADIITISTFILVEKYKTKTPIKKSKYGDFWNTYLIEQNIVPQI